jgi:CBS domain containing-hemolysin-like protein
MNTHDPVNPPPPASGELRPAEPAPDSTRSGESWLDRLKAIVGLRSGSLRTDLEEVLAEDKAGKAEFSPAERTMLQNILELEKRRIGDLMVPRADIFAVQKNIPIGNLLKVFASAGHSRLVVYDDTLDDPTGMVHIRDLVAYLTERATIAAEENARRNQPLPADLDPRSVDLTEPLSATQIVRRILFVPRSMPAIDLLVKMQATHIHLALVIDEYGGTDGLASMEDIVELIVGDIEDEHDDEAARIVLQGDGSFIADARASLDEAAEKIGAAFAGGEAVEEVDTLGGLLVMLAGRVPVRGEILAGPDDFEIEVLDADPRRVKRLRIYRRPPGPPRREARRRQAEDGPTVAPSLPTAVPEPAARTARSADESSS